ncbi:hypothetical protein VOI54_03930 [Tamlana sp. 2201CG12-4]|uniref:hypothetical protein n=1 Tax=Tamlana sp. 2201CG12-4 TaxID=3112582 RepID=UPI002DB70A7B|nr:hypothetical protein [Tamlana sp. 2201CG12-4]MEC3906153.1 hypothetical protein [Tamlana sp. 2201CG12-4]
MKITSLILIQIAFFFGHSQEFKKLDEDLSISIRKVEHVNPVFFDTPRYGKSKAIAEKLATIYIRFKLRGELSGTIIDFNKLSLVDNNRNLRHRPKQFFFDYYEVKKIKLKDFKHEDSFLKYSQEGIEDFDHYLLESTKTAGVKDISHQFRLAPVIIPNENIKRLNKKKNKFYSVLFPTKEKEKGSYTLYYEDVEVYSFTVKKNESFKVD